MIVQKTTVFPGSRETIFEKLQKLETLQYIARPFATFEPVLRAQTKEMDPVVGKDISGAVRRISHET